MRRTLAKAALAACLTLTSVAVGTVTSPPPTAAAALPCTDLTVIWVRGTGVSISSDGFQTAYLKKMRETMPSMASISSISLAYPANPQVSTEAAWVAIIEYLLGNGTIGRTYVQQYLKSVNDGVVMLRTTIENRIRQCGSTRGIILAGHSQGGHVIGDYMQTNVVPPAVLAAHMFGEPRFNGTDTAVAEGDAQAVGAVEGVANLIRSLGYREFPAIRGKFSSATAERVKSYCHDEDPICDKPLTPLGVADKIDPHHKVSSYTTWIGAAAKSALPAVRAMLSKLDTHAGDIIWATDMRISVGCTAGQGIANCSKGTMRRAQMAATLADSLSLAPLSGTAFRDLSGYTGFAGDIYAIRAKGITRGCNPPTNDRYCPGDPVTRAQMASFLVRAYGLPATTRDYFTDDETSVHEADINALARSGITLGCTSTRFCPDDSVLQGQMASFIRRAET